MHPIRSWRFKCKGELNCRWQCLHFERLLIKISSEERLLLLFGSGFGDTERELVREGIFLNKMNL